MAFTQSFEIGNSTFMNLESQVKRAINVKLITSNDAVKEKDLEVIQESPTKESYLSKTRSRLLVGNQSNANGSVRRRAFQRSKSDSTLGELKEAKIKLKSQQGEVAENYSDFFKSDFTFSNEEQVEKQESMVRVSQIAATLGVPQDQSQNSDDIETALERPIFSEDIKLLLESGANNEEQWQDSLRSSPILEKAAELTKHERINILATEDLNQLDTSSFLCPPADCNALQRITIELQRSRRELAKAVNVSVATKQSATFASNRLANEMSPAQLNWSTNTPTEAFNTNSISLEIQQPTPKTKYNIKDLESLKRISAWNLPHSVLQAYEQKGVNKMFDWQVECLSNPKILFEHCNLVYSAPTSAGKTLVSEILLLKTVLERNKKVILILPFISVVREKMFYLQDLLTSAGYRVEGFFGGYTPPGGFDSINVAICTIEKANSIVNKLLEQGRLDEIGTVIVDEVHLISDPGRGYILELLLAKILYMSRKYALQIQIITMSATLANIELLKRWLNAELFITNFRPVALQEMIKIGTKIYDCNMRLLRDIAKSSSCEIKQAFPILPNDSDNIAQLCIETLIEGCSVIVFCPSKDWCENLAMQLAAAIHALGKNGCEWGKRLRAQIKRDAIDEVKKQLRDIPTGLDSVLEKTITYACAFHHAGLTTEERDIVESSFKSCALKIIVATSTLSSGVNLPARRVLIRSPLFGGKQMSSLTYRQMIGRAGRTGKDTLGESILVCAESNARVGRDLITADLQPISSCLEMDSSTHLKRALLEVISSGVAASKQDIENFVNCTLLSAQKELGICEKDKTVENTEEQQKYLSDALHFLMEYEFIRLQLKEETNEQNYVATRLGMACLASSMPPTDGLILFAELQKARRCFVLESELHAVYLVTPYSVCYQMHDLDWLLFLDLYEKLPTAMKKVGELVGVKESFLVRAMRGQTKLDYKLMQIHKRFYTALALQELVNETPINVVSCKYKCTRGMLQSLQQMASTFAGIVTAFCNSLQWSTLSLLVGQFKERLYFGIHRDLIDLMRLPDLNHKRARLLFDAGITSLVELANADVFSVEKLLYNSLSFDSAKPLDNENPLEAEQRNTARNFFITGKTGLTIAEAAKFLVHEARQFLQYEIGVGNIDWTQQQTNNKTQRHHDLHMSCDEEKLQPTKNQKRKSFENTDDTTLPKLQKSNENVTNELKEQPKASINAVQLIKTSEVKKLIDNKTPKINSAREVHVVEKVMDANLKQNGKEKNINNQKYYRDVNKNAQNNQQITVKKNNEELKQNEPQKVNAKNKAEPMQLAAKEKMDHFAKPSLKNLKIRRSQELQTANTKVEIANIYTKENKTTPKQTKNAENLPVKPRRSPRNHLISSTRLDANKENDSKSKENLDKSHHVNDLFMADDSFEVNSGITNALAVADELNTPPTNKALNESNDDEIPSSQHGTEEIASTPNTASNTAHTSRFMRSAMRTQKFLATQRKQQQHKQRQMEEKDESPPVVGIAQQAIGSNSLELSNFSLDSNSLIKNPIQLNASHILSCSKLDTNASSFKSIEIIDICGDEQLFKEAFKELMTVKRFGFCLGLQKLENKRKPLIGANLLINQIGSSDSAMSTESLLFQIDNEQYLAGIAFSIADNIVYFMNMQISEKQCRNSKGLTAELKWKYLRMILCSAEHTLLIFDAKEQLKLLCRALPDLNEICVKLEDPKIGNWLLEPDKTPTYQLMAQQFAPECSALVNLCGSGRGYNSFGLDANNAILAKIRCSIEACVNVHILKGQIENLERIGTGQLLKFFKELEMPLQLSLCNMERIGFPTSEAALRRLFQQMIETMKKLETKIYEMHGTRFNLGSSTAVAKVLGLHRKANGRISTSRQILEKIDSPISQLIVTYRKLSVTLVKNIQPLLKCVQNDRIHGQSITFTATGRISMSEPNLQNVAKDFDVHLSASEPVKISCRSAFFPVDKKSCLISADFCQLEMRILAHLSQDAALLQVMNSENDIFTSIAARWNKIAAEKVSEQLRNETKQICYGIVYGMGMRSLGEALKCTEQEAKLLTEQFHAAYPGIRAYTDKVIKFARQNGYIETITGRRRYLENIHCGEPQMKTQAERQAINSTIQGSAADIAKNAILRMEKNILKYRDKLGIDVSAVRLVLHLHDELIFEVPEEKAKKIAKVLSLTMENCVKLSVPLKVKLKMGHSWGELKEIKL